MDRRKLGAEVLGTFWLVLGGCGTAVLAGRGGVGTLGICFAFGLTVVTGAYALGHVSGAHFNPAITLGLVAGKRFPAADAPGYIAAQVIGALPAAGVLFVIASGIDGFDIDATASRPTASTTSRPVATTSSPASCRGRDDGGVPARDHGRHPTVGSPPAPRPLAIGLALTLIHLISIPVTNTSVNPARSTSQAVFAGGDYLDAALAVLGGSDHRRRARRADLPGRARRPRRGPRRRP